MRRECPLLFIVTLFLGVTLAGCGSNNSTGLPLQSEQSPGLPNGPATQAQILHGRYLVTSVGCADCHNRGTDDPNDPHWLAGYMPNPANAGKFQIGRDTIYARNLTPDPTTGLGNWTIQQIHDVFTTGKDKDGNYLCPPMPWPEFRNMTDQDIWSIVAYLKSIKPVVNQVPEDVDNLGHAVDCGQFYPPTMPPLPAYPAANEVEVTNTQGPGLPNGPATRAQVLRGRYLATAAVDCAACHSVGGDNPADPNWLAGYVDNTAVNPNHTGQFSVGPDTIYAANLTPDTTTGLGGYSANQIFEAIHDGVDPASGGSLCPPMPWPSFHNFSASDTWALVAYLQSLKPVSNPVPANSEPLSCTGLAQIIPLPPYPAANEMP